MKFLKNKILIFILFLIAVLSAFILFPVHASITRVTIDDCTYDLNDSDYTAVFVSTTSTSATFSPPETVVYEGKTYNVTAYGVFFTVDNTPISALIETLSDSGSRIVTREVTVQFNKTDSETGDPVGGATFDIYEDGIKVGSVTTLDDGTASYIRSETKTITSKTYSEEYALNYNELTEEKKAETQTQAQAQAKIEAAIQADLDAQESVFKNAQHAYSTVEVIPPQGYIGLDGTLYSLHIKDSTITTVTKSTLDESKVNDAVNFTIKPYYPNNGYRLFEVELSGPFSQIKNNNYTFSVSDGSFPTNNNQPVSNYFPEFTTGGNNMTYQKYSAITADYSNTNKSEINRILELKNAGVNDFGILFDARTTNWSDQYSNQYYIGGYKLVSSQGVGSVYGGYYGLDEEAFSSNSYNLGYRRARFTPSLLTFYSDTTTDPIISAKFIVQLTEDQHPNKRDSELIMYIDDVPVQSFQVSW